MLKLLAFLLFCVMILRGVGLLFRYLLRGTSTNRPGQRYAQQARRPADGNVNVDFVPNDKEQKKGKFDGGEYVDYEDVD